MRNCFFCKRQNHYYIKFKLKIEIKIEINEKSDCFICGIRCPCICRSRKMEKEQPIDKGQVTTKEAISLLENKSTQESAEIESNY